MNMLPIQERMIRLAELQQQTIDMIKQGWNYNSGIVCIRPTGFGKTFTAGRLLREKIKAGGYVYKNIVFICPGEAVMMQFNNELLFEGNQKEQIPCSIYRNGKNVYKHDNYTKVDGIIIREMTYALIAKRFGTYFETNATASPEIESEIYKLFGKDVDLIIMDEFHNAGGPKTLFGLTMILNTFYTETKKLGLTATYDRTDSLDVGYELFGTQCLIEEYTYPEAVSDGVLPSIKYFCNDYRLMEKIENELDKLGEIAKTNKLINAQLKKLRLEFFEKYKMTNMSQAITRNTIETIGEANANFSQKWLVFFPTQNSLLTNYDRVVGWYKNAWPNHEVRSIIVINTPEYKSNRELVCKHGYHMYNPKRNEKVVTLIFSVQMLLEAVHLDNVTGLLLFTHTLSQVKYYQTLGRVIDSKRETEPLIIDMMDGYNELYDSLQNDINRAKQMIDRGPKANSRRKSTVVGADNNNNTANNTTQQDGSNNLTLEQNDILSQVTVQSNQYTFDEFLKRLVKLGNLAKLRRVAMAIMNKYIGFTTGARATSLPIDMLMDEITRIQENKEFVASEIMRATKAIHEKYLRAENTYITDPLTNEDYINVIYSENGCIDEADYNAIMEEYKAVKNHLASRKGKK